MATTAPTWTSATAAVRAPGRLILVLVQALVQWVTLKMASCVCRSTYRVALLAAMATTAPPMMCAMAVVHAPAHLFLAQALQLAPPTTHPMVQAVWQISHQRERFVMTVTTVPPMMCAMAAVAVLAHLFLAPAPQLAPPTTRPMAQAVYLPSRHRAWAVTMVTTAQKMMRAMAVARVQVCLMLAPAQQLAHSTTFKMAQDALLSMQSPELPATTAIPPQAATAAMAWECVRGLFSLRYRETLFMNV